MSGQTNDPRGHILVHDAAVLTDEVLEALRRRGFFVARSFSAVSLLSQVREGKYGVVVTDLVGEAQAEIAAIERLSDELPLVNVLVVTRTPRLETALSALRAGAYDHLTWPTPVDALALALDRAVQNRLLRREVRRLRRVLNPGLGFEGVIGDSPAMREVFDLMNKVASARAPVLVTGETGTGKELVARGLHSAGKRSGGPFVAVNCAALPEALLESELFGHARGAFTDAKAAKKGLFLRASGGTLFLDEIGEMPLGLQAKLLRVLQMKAVRPVGGEQEVPFDARIVSATNRDLEAMVEQGAFREDLYYRIHVIHIELPPLRARGGDILQLAEHFLHQAAAIAGESPPALSSDAARRLLEYPWAGNIRELENAMERAVALNPEGPVTVADLPNRVRNWMPSHVLVASADPEELVTLRTMEERYVRRVLAATGGNRSSAARVLGIDRKSLYRKLQRYGIPKEAKRE